MDGPRARFAAELRRWAVRSVACAAPSAVVAATYGHNRVSDWLAMASGTAAFAVLFASFSVRHAAKHRVALRAFVRAVRLKAILGVSVLFILLGKRAHLPAWLRILGLPVGVDVFTGALVAMEVEGGHGVLGAYLSTLLITLLQGVMITLECGILTFLQLLLLPPVDDNPFRARSRWRRRR